MAPLNRRTDAAEVVPSLRLQLQHDRARVWTWRSKLKAQAVEVLESWFGGSHVEILWRWDRVGAVEDSKISTDAQPECLVGAL